MKVLTTRNVHRVLPAALRLLAAEGEVRNSRNGPVKVTPFPVATVYEMPTERVIFWPERDANPFFHLYESLWMLAGRNDLAPLVRYASHFGEYSDDGETLHGAYGYRWKNYFIADQLDEIVERLRKDSTDRRCVLQMWEADADLFAPGKDVPCNLTATFQRDSTGLLNLTVFCRSNDIIWGAYGANAVHFSILLEYIALRINCGVGTYTQISVNWHAYEKVYGALLILAERFSRTDPYVEGLVRSVPLRWRGGPEEMKRFDAQNLNLLACVDSDFKLGFTPGGQHSFCSIAYKVLKAHHYWKTLPPPERFIKAQAELVSVLDTQSDWVIAANQWLQRRHARWEEKMRVEQEEKK